MHWKLKAHGMAVLSRLPAGRWLYHSLQRWLGTNRLSATEGTSRALEIVELIQQSGGNLVGATCLEVGTGWRPFLPFVLHLAGVQRTLTLDINPWLTYPYAAATEQAIQACADTISERLGLSNDTVKGRLPSGSQVQTLGQLLQAFGTDYVSPADATCTGLPNESVDFVCSSNVLEHIEPNTLRAIHRETNRILKPGGFCVHRFNPGDHFISVDRSITAANFLRFSPEQWHWYAGSGLSYHNRLRCLQHMELFESAGLQVVHSRVRIDQRSLEAIRSGELPLHSDYRKFTPEELAADYMWIVATRTAQTDDRQFAATTAHSNRQAADRSQC